MEELNKKLVNAKNEIFAFSKNNKELPFPDSVFQEVMQLIDIEISSKDKNVENLLNSISYLPSGSDFLNSYISPSLKEIREALNQINTEQFNILKNPLFYAIIILELLVLPIWWIAVVFSIPGTGPSWQYWLGVGPTISYPALIIICAIWSANIKNEKSFLVILLPPIIAVGWPLILATIFG